MVQTKLFDVVVDALLSHPEPPSGARHSFPQLPRVLAADGSQVIPSPETALSQRMLWGSMLWLLSIQPPGNAGVQSPIPNPSLASTGNYCVRTS